MFNLVLSRGKDSTLKGWLSRGEGDYLLLGAVAAPPHTGRAATDGTERTDGTEGRWQRHRTRDWADGNGRTETEETEGTDETEGRRWPRHCTRDGADGADGTDGAEGREGHGGKFS